MAKHATRIFQPSSFKRTLGCPGWGNLCKDIPPKPSNKYAAEGSVAHHLGEICLSKDQQAADYVGGTGWYNNGRTGINSSDIAPREEKAEHFIFPITEEMAEAVQVYLDEVRSKRARMVGATFLIEERLNLGWVVPGMYGTGDHLAIEPLGCIYVDDYKHGAGVAVEVEDNPQLMIYALGAIGKGNPHGVGEVEVTIIQPRAPHSDGPVRSIRYKVDYLMDWAENVLLPAALAAQKPDAPLCAGEWCKWCDGIDVCPETRKQALEAAEVMFDADIVPVEGAPGPPKPAVLDSEQLDRILQFSDVFEDWLKAVRAEAYDRLDKGHDNAPSAFKLVAGRLSNRAWKGDDTAVFGAFSQILPRSDIYAPKKVRSPAQIEKALKKNGIKPGDLKELVNPLLKERTPGKPLMVPVTDNRRALPPSAERMFNEDPLK